MASWNGKVLVVGATGALGRPVVQGLRQRGVAVRALCRHPQQADDLAALGAEVVAGDLTDAASLARATTGVQRVLAAAHGILGRGRWRSEAVDDAGHRSLFAAARNAGVDRLVYVSAHGASPDHPVDFFRTKHAMEQALAASGLRHVVLRPTAFMEHHAHNFNGAGLLAKGKAQLIGPGTKPRNFVAASDAASVRSPATTSAPSAARSSACSGWRHSARTATPRSSSPCTTGRPRAPVAPTTNTLPFHDAKRVSLGFAAAAAGPGRDACIFAPGDQPAGPAGTAARQSRP